MAFLGEGILREPWWVGPLGDPRGTWVLCHRLLCEIVNQEILRADVVLREKRQNCAGRGRVYRLSRRG